MAARTYSIFDKESGLRKGGKAMNGKDDGQGKKGLLGRLFRRVLSRTMDPDQAAFGPVREAPHSTKRTETTHSHAEPLGDLALFEQTMGSLLAMRGAPGDRLRVLRNNPQLLGDNVQFMLEGLVARAEQEGDERGRALFSELKEMLAHHRAEGVSPEPAPESEISAAERVEPLVRARESAAEQGDDAEELRLLREAMPLLPGSGVSTGLQSILFT